MTLDEIGQKHGTDKASRVPGHPHPTHDYLKLYEKVFEEYDNSRLELFDYQFKILELGLGHGASLRVWEEAYPYAKIVGVDLNDIGQTFGPNVEVLVCDVREDRFPGLMTERGPFDFIIDDCSHCGEMTIPTFHSLWGLVKPGGWYIIEDIQTDFDEQGWPTQKGLMRDFLREQIWRQNYGDREVVEIRCFREIWFFRKAG